MGKPIIKTRIAERKNIMVEQKETLEILGRPSPRKEFWEWFQNAENVEPAAYGLKRGSYEIEVAERLTVGEFLLGEREVAIVRDAQNRIFAVPESRECVSGKPLVSRWDIHEGMKLRVTVDEEGVPEVLILEN